MGNSPLTGLLRGKNADHSCQVPLGGSTALHFNGREIQRYNNGDDIEVSWKISYKVGATTRDLSLFRCKRNTQNHIPPQQDYNNFAIVISVGEESYSWGVERAEADLLHVDSSVYNYSSFPTNITALPMPPGNSFLTADAARGGGITETVFYLYERETRRDLMVWEWKKKDRVEKPYMATLTHYYANHEYGNRVGFSVVLKRIRVSSDDGRLDFAVDGPHQHPVKALLYMFDEVRRTGTWNPNYCPHCANYIIQRQRGMLSQSESEDSDMDDNVVPKAPLQGLVANGGRFTGNYNGNLIIRNFFARRR